MSDHVLREVPPAPRKLPCARCGGEGVTFTVDAGRAAAAPCECTRDCAICGGSGRVYEQDARGYSALAGCTCGADPRRLQLLSGLRLPFKFVHKKLQDYEPRRAEQMKALGRATRFVDTGTGADSRSGRCGAAVGAEEQFRVTGVHPEWISIVDRSQTRVVAQECASKLGGRRHRLGGNPQYGEVGQVTAAR